MGLQRIGLIQLHQVLAAHRAAWTAERKTDLKVLAAARRQGCVKPGRRGWKIPQTNEALSGYRLSAKVRHGE
ncbi:hypothetical protein OG520_44810 (plasmid) [Streptomyces sp. NBC_00984]|uniref:hypothetical protein n=1 Tax=Streptomyces sp. NBC_00984 TaxID=2903700 RepID=UPI002F91AD42|nr:hypothetical protein OG520_44810 [Streptomyces sp. NBC_00984]